MKLNHLEYDIIDYCNLNCKGCSHFCNINKEKKMVSIKDYEEDLKRIKEFITEIELYKILGGEPLLHNNIEKIIKITRQYYPKSKIVIGTNGLIFLKKEETFFETLKKYNIEVLISMYEKNKKIIKQIIKKLKTYSIKYYIIYKNDKFRKNILNKENKENILDTFENCSLKVSNNLSNGRLNICAIANYIERLNKRFNVNYPLTSINIHKPGISQDDIKNILTKPNEMCKYCTKYYVEFKQDISNYEDAKISDYLINDEELEKEKRRYKLKNNYVYKKISQKYLGIKKRIIQNIKSRKHT